ncbi:hypothetical protein N2152v2_009691 [Parachlorella kessleri]
MATATADEKQALRKLLKQGLRSLTEEQMRDESAAIAQRVLSLGFLQRCRQLAVYVHCPRLREVDSSAILDTVLQQGTRCYVPRVQDKDANMHFLHLDSPHSLVAVPPFGIREPRPEYADGSPREDALEVDTPLEAVVMPGLGFTREGHRLGRGGGYYDKFIEGCWQRAVEKRWDPPLLIALSYRAQLVERVPIDPHDLPVDVIVTADEVIRCSQRGQELR